MRRDYSWTDESGRHGKDLRMKTRADTGVDAEMGQRIDVFLVD